MDAQATASIKAKIQSVVDKMQAVGLKDNRDNERQELQSIAEVIQGSWTKHFGRPPQAILASSNGINVKLKSMHEEELKAEQAAQELL